MYIHLCDLIKPGDGPVRYVKLPEDKHYQYSLVI